MKLSKYVRIVFCLAAGGLFLAGLLLRLNEPSQAAHAAPNDLFVIPGGSGDCSQPSPCDLATALSTASDGDSLYLAEGAYTGSGDGAVITVTHNNTLYGGWDGSTTTPPARNPAAHPTTIDGEGARRGVVVESGITVTLEGLAITNGMDTYQGAGLYARDAHLTLRHVTVYSNVIDVIDVPDTYAYGSGAMVEGGTLLVEASTFRSNSAWAKKSSYGGGLAISGSLSATVTNSLFQDNDAWVASGLYFLGHSGSRSPFTLHNSTFTGNGRGRSNGRASGGYAGAIEIVNAKAQLEKNTVSDSQAANDYGVLGVFSSDLLLARNVIVSNYCARTSGLYLISVSPFTITNNIIAGNQSGYNWLSNPAVLVRGGQGQFLHNTVAHNTGTYGVLADSGAVVALTNTILVSYTTGISVSAGSTASLEGTLWGSGDWANVTDWDGDGGILTGTVNVWGDPGFVNPAGGNYRIGPGSAALDAGVDAGVTIDIDGDARPANAGYDIGADEYVVRFLYLPLVMKSHP